MTFALFPPIQYLGWWHSYDRAIKAALVMPQYRTRAKQIAEKKRLLPLEKSKTKKVPRVRTLAFNPMLSVGTASNSLRP